MLALKKARRFCLKSLPIGLDKMLIREITSKNQFWLDLNSINFSELEQQVENLVNGANTMLRLKHRSKYSLLQNSIAELDQKLYDVLSANYPDKNDFDLSIKLEKIKDLRKQLKSSYDSLD